MHLPVNKIVSNLHICMENYRTFEKMYVYIESLIQNLYEVSDSIYYYPL
jgi:hypothetical protein